MSYLGVDIGTTGCKVTVINELGDIIHHDSQGYDLILSDGVRAELSPRDIWQAFLFLLQKAVNVLQKKDPVRALSLSVLGEAIMPMDESGQPLANTLVSMDYRAGAETRIIAERIGTDTIYGITGQQCHPMYSASKILWWKNHAPGIFRRAWKFFGWEEYLCYRLCGRPAVDHSLATRTMLFDIKNKCWSSSILDAIELSPDLFSTVVASGAPLGTISEKVCHEYDLPRGIQLVSGAWDQVCSALGVGLSVPDIFLDSFGTTVCLGIYSDFPLLSPDLYVGGYQTTCYIFPGSYFINGGTMNGGVLLRWFRDRIKNELRDQFAQEGKDFFVETIESLSEKPSSIMFFPYFAGRGTPYLDPNRTGFCVGLTCETSSQDILKGLLEGICFEARMNLDYLEKHLGITFNEVISVGGGSRSPFFLQLKATIYKKSLRSFEYADLSSYGAALIALAGLEGWQKAFEIIERLQTNSNQYEPQKERGILYSKKYQKYQKLSRLEL
jgi:xylulokinase